MLKKALPSDRDVAGRISRAILDFVSKLPKTAETSHRSPRERARTIANVAALQASAVSGTLALPTGPAGLLTVIPELVAVWRIQAKMVADIAGAFGRTEVPREQMLYCLFRHSAAQAVRDLAVRAGERYLVRKSSLRAVEAVAGRIGIRLTRRVIAKSVSRWLPIVGALGVAGYAYYDTAQVAATAIALFEQESSIEPA